MTNHPFVRSGTGKKIIFSNYDDIKNPYYGGGGAVAVHEVAKRLKSEHGYEVSVITGRYPESKNEIIDGVIYKRIGLSQANPKLSQLIFQALLPFYAATEHFDFWIESFTPPFSTAFLPRFTDKPVVGLTHLLGGKNMSKKYKLPFYRIENAGLKNYKYVIALTAAVERQILSVNKNIKTSVIPNGLDKSLMGTEIIKIPEHILFLGRIDIEQKGLDLLVEACRLAGSRLRDKLVIAGDGQKDDKDFLAETIKNSDLAEKIEIFGKAAGKQKEELYKNAKFFVMPSRFETFPLTILEAFAFGCPVILFDVENLKWVPADCAIKIPPFSSKKFAEAMVALSQNPDRLLEMGSRARDFVKRYDWTVITKQYANFLKTI